MLGTRPPAAGAQSPLGGLIEAVQKEAARLQIEAQLAEVVSRNGDLANEYAEIDAHLAVTLESLKITNVEHHRSSLAGWE